MTETGRNRPCPCGSGKKYKNCCLQNAEALGLLNFKYDKYLEVRNRACGKVFGIGIEHLGIGDSDPTFYLLDFLLSPVDPAEVRSREDLNFFLNDLAFLFTIFGYPIFDLVEFEGELDDFGYNPESIEDNYLWRYCLKKHSQDFTKQEMQFLQSLNRAAAGFFKVRNILHIENKQHYPIIEAEDIFSGIVYKIMDKSLPQTLVRHDMLSGIIAPFHEDIHVMESCPPILYAMQDRGVLEELIKEYAQVYRSNYAHLFSEKDGLSKLFKLFPVIIYLVALDYFLIRITRKMPKMVNYDKEEIVLSETVYRFEDRELIKKKLAGIKGISVSSDGKQVLLHWMNQKNTVLASIIIKRKRLYVQTNSLERQEKWKEMVKDLPLEYVKTAYIDLEDIQARYAPNKKSSLEEKTNEHDPAIADADFKRLANEWWQKYYDDWVDAKLPALGNMTPREAVKTSKGRKQVEALIDESENFYLHAKKDHPDKNNFHQYFNPEELRKRLL